MPQIGLEGGGDFNSIDYVVDHATTAYLRNQRALRRIGLAQYTSDMLSYTRQIEKYLEDTHVNMKALSTYADRVDVAVGASASVSSHHHSSLEYPSSSPHPQPASAGEGALMETRKPSEAPEDAGVNNNKNNNDSQYCTATRSLPSGYSPPGAHYRTPTPGANTSSVITAPVAVNAGSSLLPSQMAAAVPVRGQPARHPLGASRNSGNASMWNSECFGTMVRSIYENQLPVGGQSSGTSGGTADITTNTTSNTNTNTRGVPPSPFLSEGSNTSATAHVNGYSPCPEVQNMSISDDDGGAGGGGAIVIGTSDLVAPKLTSVLAVSQDDHRESGALLTAAANAGAGPTNREGFKLPNSGEELKNVMTQLRAMMPVQTPPSVRATSGTASPSPPHSIFTPVLRPRPVSAQTQAPASPPLSTSSGASRRSSFPQALRTSVETGSALQEQRSPIVNMVGSPPSSGAVIFHVPSPRRVGESCNPASHAVDDMRLAVSPCENAAALPPLMTQATQLQYMQWLIDRRGSR